MGLFFSINEAFASPGRGGLWGEQQIGFRSPVRREEEKCHHQWWGASFPGLAGNLGTSQRATSLSRPYSKFLLHAGRGKRDTCPGEALLGSPCVLCRLVPHWSSQVWGVRKEARGPGCGSWVLRAHRISRPLHVFTGHQGLF